MTKGEIIVEAAAMLIAIFSCAALSILFFAIFMVALTGGF